MLCLEGEQEMPAADDEVLSKGREIVVMNGWGPKE